jgi:flagellar basal-body rod modification protein FlgD
MNSIQDMAIFNELGLSQTPKTEKKKETLGQEDFLTLMTTQLRNQDPFKPMDNGEFLSQLAQFGTVSGINELKTSFGDLSNSLYSNQSLQAAGMVGHEVLVPSRYGLLAQGGALGGAVDLPEAASNLSVGIYDMTGQLVRKVDLGVQPAGLVKFSWDGLSTDGAPAPPGRYEIRAEAIHGGINEAYDVLMTTQVESVTLPKGGGALTLELAGIGQVDFSDIRQIR